MTKEKFYDMTGCFDATILLIITTIRQGKIEKCVNGWGANYQGRYSTTE
jgi:hypothetical protein